MSCNNVDTNDCGCSHTHDSKCIIYTGQNLSCISVVSGDDLTTVLENINDTICSLTPSGVPTVVLQEGTNIDVTSTTVDGITTYTITLDPSIKTTLDTNTNSIAAINACLAGGVRDIVSSTLAITVDSPNNGCGEILRIESIAPSSVPLEAGIIYNDSTKVGATGGTGGDLTLKTSVSSISAYETNIGFQVGDEIRWRATGQIDGGVGDMDDVKFDLFDTPTGLIPSSGVIFNGFGSSTKASWLMNGTITILDNTPLNSTLLVSATLQRTQTENDVVSNANRDIYIINKEVTGVDLSTLILRIRYVRNVNASYSATNFARQLMVEVVKAI